MRLIWTPPEGERQEYRFDLKGTTSPDGEAIELVGGEAWQTWDEFTRLFRDGQRRALRAALWICRRNAGEPDLQFRDLRLRMDEVRIEHDADELATIRAHLRNDKSITDELRQQLLEIYGGADADAPEETAAPKASPSDSPSPDQDTEPGAASTAG